MTYLDQETTKIMTDLSSNLYATKNKWRKILRNGLEIPDLNLPTKEVQSRYGKRLLYTYKKRYFSSVNELMQYMTDELNKKLTKPNVDNK